MHWVIIYLGLGANIGEPPEIMERLRQAAQNIGNVGDIRLVAASSLYRTKAWGVEEQPDFINAVLKCETRLEPSDLLTTLKTIEQQLGRQTTYRWGPRVLDIDILLYGNQSISNPGLSIPHPGLLERPFVTVPLLEIENDARLPSGELVRDRIGVKSSDETVELLEPF